MSEIKEKPVLFSGQMVRAILEGRKTVTRRAVKPAFPVSVIQVLPFAGDHSAWMPVMPGTPDQPWDEQARICPYGKPGDRLWVRESTEADYDTHDAVTLARYCADKAPVLVTDCADPELNGSVAHWNYPRDVRPSIHMKREQARILLEITAVRIERLQDISEEQAEAEGIDFLRHAPDADETLTAKQLFECLWCGINGDDSWNANPWVWVVEFKRVTP